MVNNFKLEIETTSGVSTITQGEPETPIQKLNRLAIEAGFDDISPYAIDYVGFTEDRTSTTILYNRGDDAYILAPPIAGTVRTYQRDGIHRVPEGYQGGVGVHRALISYSAATRINTVADMVRTLSPIINVGVQDLINQFGNIMHGYKIAMVQLGWPQEYFRDSDNAAAFEIRLYLHKTV